MAAGAPVLLASLPGLAGYYYLTNYGFEILYVSAMMLAAALIDRSRRAGWVLGALIALSPLFVLGGLFALPGLVVCALWSAARIEETRDRRPVQVRHRGRRRRRRRGQPGRVPARLPHRGQQAEHH